MPLIDSIPFTKFKNLKFSDYGDSPLIENDINDPQNINKNIFTASLTDTKRISKFLATSKGLEFITKQMALQSMNPNQESFPQTGIGFLNNIVNTLGKVGLIPTKLYNLGINTLTQIPLTGIGGHVQRHGLSPKGTPEQFKYGEVVKKNNLLVNDNDFNKGSSSNRLANLLFKLNIETPSRHSSFKPQGNLKNKILNVFSTIGKLINNTSLQGLNNQYNIIDEYIGGPNSLGGIGTTVIKRYEQTGNIQSTIDNLQKVKEKTDNIKTEIISELYNKYTSQNIDDNHNISQEKVSYNNVGIINKVKSNQSLNNQLSSTIPKLNSKYEELKNIIESKKLKPNVFLDDNNKEYNSFNIIKTKDPLTTDLTQLYYNNSGSIQYINHYGDVYKAVGTWKEKNRETRIGSGRKDEINLTPMFRQKDSVLHDYVKIGGIEYLVRDLVKFRIEAIDNDNPSESIMMVFRSYLKGFTDSHNPEWNSVSYSGRGEDFYIYNKTKRSISFNFKIAALSSVEMMPMYQKLNYLTSNTYADYNSQGLMRGSFMRITIGNYLHRTPCIINGLTYTISDDTPWEIAMSEEDVKKSNISQNPSSLSKYKDVYMYELPHIIDVQMSITPIQEFLPSKNPKNGFIIDKGNEAPENVSNPWLNKYLDLNPFK